jgi:hypothetical protein
VPGELAMRRGITGMERHSTNGSRKLKGGLAKSAFFKIERGRFKPLQTDATALPASSLLRFEGEDLCSRLQGLLRFLAPLSKGR